MSKPVSEQEIGRQLLMETVAYAESGDCAGRFCSVILARIIPRIIVGM